MIVKKVPAFQAGSGVRDARAAHARRLVDYINKPEHESDFGAYLLDYIRSKGD